MIVGYARTSTTDQKAGYEAQLRDLAAAGCEKVFKEQVSSIAEREQLNAALDFVREGDTFVVTKLDRLARSTAHLLEIVEKLNDKGVGLHILDPDINTNSVFGELILTVIGAIAQFERKMMLERQREGIKKARDDGRYRGRPPLKIAKVEEMRSLLAQGFNPTQVARKMKVARSTVYRLAMTEERARAAEVARREYVGKSRRAAG